MIRPIAILASSNLGAQALNVAAYPVLAYLYSPADFGVFGVMTSVAVTAGMIVCARLDTIVQIERKRSEMHLVRLAVVLGIFMAALVGLTSFALILTGVLPIPATDFSTVALAVFLASAALLNGVYAVGYQLQVKASRYDLVARAQLVRIAVAALCQVGLGLLFGGYWGLLIGFTFGSLLAVVMLSPFREVLSGWDLRSLLTGIRIARKRQKMIALDCMNTLISSSFAPLQLVLITALYGATGAGLFVLASRLLTAPSQAIGGSISAIYFQKSSQHVRDRNLLRPLFLRSLLLAFALGATMALGVILALEWFVITFLPISWVGVVPLGTALIPVLIGNMMLSGVGYTGLALGKPHFSTALSIYQICGLSGTFMLSEGLSLDLAGFVTVNGVFIIAGVIVFIATLFFAVQRHDRTITSPPRAD